MTLSTAIITEVRQNVLLVPNSAVKQKSGMSYVEVPSELDMPSAAANMSSAVFKNPMRQQQVETGLSNDEFTEIISGLEQNDIIITKIIKPGSAQTAQTQQNSSIRIPGFNTGAGQMRMR